MSNAPRFSSRLLHLQGDHYQMGYQHGQQVKKLRPTIIFAVKSRLAQLEQDNPGPAFEALLQDTQQTLYEIDPAIINFIRGQAEGLAINFEWLLRYNLINFLRDALLADQQSAAGPEGCTTWAASGLATIDGRPILVKNRDYRPEHLSLQMVVQAEPAIGYRYLYVTSAGNPGVFVAGLNEAGLAVADTHVPCPDVGPGLPTYALLMHILEEHRTVTSAMAYLQSVPRLGRNNIVLADAEGKLAVFENSHRQGVEVKADTDFVIATNHYNSPQLAACYVETEPQSLQGNSWQRYRQVKETLTAAYSQIDLVLAKELMAAHNGPLTSICRHSLPNSNSSTISSMILLPESFQLLFCYGQPCREPYKNLLAQPPKNQHSG